VWRGDLCKGGVEELGRRGEGWCRVQAVGKVGRCFGNRQNFRAEEDDEPGGERLILRHNKTPVHRPFRLLLFRYFTPRKG